MRGQKSPCRLGGWWLTFVLSEKVGMCACINHDKNKLLVVLLPDKQPIGLNVTLPLVLAVRVRTF